MQDPTSDLIRNTRKVVSRRPFEPGLIIRTQRDYHILRSFTLGLVSGSLRYFCNECQCHSIGSLCESDGEGILSGIQTGSKDFHLLSDPNLDNTNRYLSVLPYK